MIPDRARGRLCAVCRREARGFGWFDAGLPIDDPRRDASRKWLCSRRCQDICHRRRGVIDPTADEQAAMAAAVPMAGEYVDSLGKTDLVDFSRKEFLTLIEVIVTAYVDRLRDLAEAGRGPEEVPF